MSLASDLHHIRAVCDGPILDLEALDPVIEAIYAPDRSAQDRSAPDRLAPARLARYFTDDLTARPSFTEYGVFSSASISAVKITLLVQRLLISNFISLPPSNLDHMLTSAWSSPSSDLCVIILPEIIRLAAMLRAERLDPQ